MKKKVWALAFSLLLTLSFSACGEQSGSESHTDQNAPEGFGTDGSLETDSGLFQDSPDGSLLFSSLTDWYNSEARTQLEEVSNEMLSDATFLHAFITIEEPDILIYNYQYTVPLSSFGLSHEEAAAITASNLQELDSVSFAKDDIKNFQAYGIHLKLIRMNYLDFDGTLVYTTDIKGDNGSPALPDNSDTSAGLYGSLQEWMDSSEDAALTVQTTNRALASTGITFDLTVDGNILVYKYCLPDGYFTDGLAEEEQTEAFDSMVDAGFVSAKTVLSMFSDRYGLSPDAVRFVFCSGDGTILYSRDVKP